MRSAAAKSTERTERLEARITRRQKSLFRQAAALQGRSLSDFVVQSASEAAAKALRESRIIEITADEQKRLLEILANPPAPGPRLRAAVRRRRELLGE
jgi:uncharacterized protein (DUF1778 family)